jgi:hypothetical protein
MAVPESARAKLVTECCFTSQPRKSGSATLFLGIPSSASSVNPPHLRRETRFQRAIGIELFGINPAESVDAVQFGSTQLALGNNLAGERDGLVEFFRVKRATIWNEQTRLAFNHQPRLRHALLVPGGCHRQMTVKASECFAFGFGITPELPGQVWLRGQAVYLRHAHPR